MENTIFAKMKVKKDSTACVSYPPENYPVASVEICFKSKAEQADFVHLFVTSREQLAERMEQALAKRKQDGLFWISYPKSNGKNKYDINRDSLWDLSIPYGIHPVSQISLDEVWPAVRFADNKPGVVYKRPKN